MRRRRPILSAAGGSREWTRIVEEYVAVHRICWLRFPRCTIRSQTIDHYWPMKYRPDLVADPRNHRPACHYCNRARRHTLPQNIPKLRAKLEARARIAKSRTSTALDFFT